MNKKGVDAVVATVLIIMITVAAVAIIWSTVIPMIKDSASSVTAEKVSLTIDTSKGYTTWDQESEQATVQVTRGTDNVNVTKIKITFFNGQRSYFVEREAPGINSQATYKILLMDFGKPIKVTISPIFENGNEGEILGEVLTLPDNAQDLEKTPGDVSPEGLVIPTAYNNHNCNSTYVDCNIGDWVYDVPVSCPSPSFCTVNDGPSRGWQCYDSGNIQSYRCTFGNLGASCLADNDCLSGRCAIDDCTFDCSGTTLCIEGNIGDYCDSNSDCDSGICGASYTCSSGEVDSYCSDVSQCKSGLYCDRDYTGKCTTGVTGLASCGAGSSCASGFCDTYYNVCSNGAVDDNCGSDSDCSSNICESYHYQCKANKSVGTFCGSHSQCDSQYCNSVTHLCAIPILTSGLYLYFPFNETSGTTVYDYSGNSRTGTFAATSTNPAINQTGKVGKAYKFDGTNDYVNRNINLGWGAPSTISFWTNMTGTINNADSVLGRGSSSEHYLNFNLAKLSFYRYSTQYFLSTGSATANTWQQWTITRDTSNNVVIYLNGQPSGTATYNYDLYFDHIGRGYYGYYGGSIDELAVWDRGLNSTEVLALYTLNNAGTQLK